MTHKDKIQVISLSAYDIVHAHKEGFKTVSLMSKHFGVGSKKLTKRLTDLGFSISDEGEVSLRRTRR